jgi:hypothetical protein
MSTNFNGILSWVRRIFPDTTKRNVLRGRRRGFAPYLELLEGRDVPTTFTVTTLSDMPFAQGTTLRQAVGT